MGISAIILYDLVVYAWLGYVLAFLGMIFEGDATLFAFAFLTNVGFFGFYLMSAAIIGGVLCGNIFWYWLGKKFGKSKFFLVAWANRATEIFDEHLCERTFRTLFISKFTYGLNHLMLFRAGVIKIPYKKYLKYDFTAAIAWILLVGGLGYFSGASYDLIKKYVRFVEIALLALLVLFIFADYFLSKFFKKKLISKKQK